jgi:hypothetical protein
MPCADMIKCPKCSKEMIGTGKCAKCAKG